MFSSSNTVLLRSRNILSNSIFHWRNTQCLRSTNINVENPIVLTDDGTTIVCWHPEKEFPYDCTRPMPEVQFKESTVLKPEAYEARKVFHKQRPENEVREQLAKMTHTTIHRWFPRSRDKKAKKTPKDRPYL